MLSTHSFNALLKTLEEPPPHVKFLLATTDPQKLPVTVLSRCLQFNLKRLPVAQITERMREILEKEGIAFEPAGLRLVAQAADGSMRDGLSLLDQLIAFGGGKAGEEEARAMLGTIARDHVVRLAELLGAMDVPELLSCARSLEEFAPDYAQVLDELASLFVRIAMKQAVSDFEGDELYDPEVLARLAKAIAPEDVQLFYQTAITGRRDLGLAPDPRAGFEMTLLRMIAFRPLGEAEQARGPAPVTGAAPSAGAGAAAARAAAAAAGARGSGGAGGPLRGAASSVGVSAETVGAGAASAAGARASDGAGIDEPWSTLIARLELGGAARQLASNCQMMGRQGDVLRLALDARNKHMRTPAQEDKLAQALSRYFGQPIRLEFETAAPVSKRPRWLSNAPRWRISTRPGARSSPTLACKGCASALAQRYCPIQFVP